VNVTRWHNRRNCVFVYHLADIILEQHDELIERFDLALQFDSVDQED
jgi:hypothetical protein